MRTIRLCSLALLAACAHSPPPEPIPDGLRVMIANLEREPVANPPLWVAQYDYKGQVVYYIPPRCCDIMGALVTSDGKTICSPDGGMTGRGDGRCPDFFVERRNEKIIWRDPRAPADRPAPRTSG
jgi:hypothetical protein